MKTLAVTAARQNLGHWLKRALAGEDIGIVVEGQIVGLRPVEVISSDYALREYGVSETQLDRAASKVEREVESARKAGKLVPFRGKLYGPD
jgi:antitoxin (DNA-binding transcriptional repressor) of toxin-antitoxin stability system